MKTAGRILVLLGVALTMGVPALSGVAQGAISYSVGGTGPIHLPGPLTPPLDSVWGPNGYPGDTVELLPYSDSIPSAPGSYTQKINTLSWIIDYTYGDSTYALPPDEPWPDMPLNFDASRNMSVGATPGSLSQSGLLRVNWYNDYLSMLLGSTTTFFDVGYQVDVTPLGLEEVPGSNFDGNNPWLQPELTVMARFDVTSAAVPEASSAVVWSLIGLTIGATGWWQRKRLSAFTT
jgi:hypothetical protein